MSSDHLSHTGLKPPMLAIAEFLRPIALRAPRRVTSASAWIEHIPFAMNLIEVLRPRLVVELGTHAGDSYCAFCQAVDELGAETRCYAVDTWKGDEHAGRYPEEVLSELRAHHDPLYGRFSTLIRATFDEASREFEDGSIDLLHIDGYHTFEAVRDDYQTWKPKLGPEALVLFHDTSVRERDFGVWRLWSELSTPGRSFEFFHGHGLGVLAPNAVPEGLGAFLSASEEELSALRGLYAELGRRIAIEREALAAARENQQLRRDNDHWLADIRELKAAQTALEGKAADAERQLASSLAEAARAEARRAEAQDAAAGAERATAVARMEAQALLLRLEDAHRVTATAHAEIERLSALLAGFEGSLGCRLVKRCNDVWAAALARTTSIRASLDRRGR